jgi:hypothetical protein
MSEKQSIKVLLPEFKLKAQIYYFTGNTKHNSVCIPINSSE